MLQDAGGQRVVFGEFFEHFFVGATRAAGGFLDDRQTQLVKENFTQLFGAGQVEGLTSDLIRLLLELHNALT